MTRSKMPSLTQRGAWYQSPWPSSSAPSDPATPAMAHLDQHMLSPQSCLHAYATQGVVRLVVKHTRVSQSKLNKFIQ